MFPSVADLKTWAWWKKKLLKHFLPLGFLFVLIIGLTWPEPGAEVASWKAGDYKIVNTVNVCTIFVISGLTLKTDEAVQALKKPAGLIYGLLAILVITPMLGFAMLEIPFDQKAFARGLAIFCTVPTTLSSGVALVTAAYGNAALALMLTVTSNLIGIVSTPFLLKAIFDSSNASLDAVDLLIKLLLTILLPLAVGKAAQTLVPGIKPRIKKHKTLLSFISNASLIMIVWQTISGSQDSITSTPFGQICLLILAGAALHVAFLAINYVATALVLRLPPREFKAVLIMGSQKTLPVSVTIISYFPAAFGAQGLLTLPCIVGHMVQLFIDAVIVSRMAAAEDARQLADKGRGGDATNGEVPPEAAALGPGDSAAGARDKDLEAASAHSPAESGTVPAVAPGGEGLTIVQRRSSVGEGEAHNGARVGTDVHI